MVTLGDILSRYSKKVLYFKRQSSSLFPPFNLATHKSPFTSILHKIFQTKVLKINLFFSPSQSACVLNIFALFHIVILSHALLSASYFFCLMVGEFMLDYQNFSRNVYMLMFLLNESKFAHILLVMMFRFIR